MVPGANLILGLDGITPLASMETPVAIDFSTD